MGSNTGMTVQGTFCSDVIRPSVCGTLTDKKQVRTAPAVPSPPPHPSFQANRAIRILQRMTSVCPSWISYHRKTEFLTNKVQNLTLEDLREKCATIELAVRSPIFENFCNLWMKAVNNHSSLLTWDVQARIWLDCSQRLKWKELSWNLGELLEEFHIYLKQYCDGQLPFTLEQVRALMLSWLYL